MKTSGFVDFIRRQFNV